MSTENNDKNIDKESLDTEIQEIQRKKNPINLILIGLIVVMLILLAVQYSKLNNVSDDYSDLLTGDDTVVDVVPEDVKLGVELFDSESMLLDFADITLSLENEDILSYYNELVDDMSNFTPVYDKTFLPSDNIFELRFKETSTSIFIFNEVVDESVYCTVVNKGAIIGNYLIPAKYYGNLFNVVYASEGVTQHTKDIVKEDIPELIQNEAEVAITLDSNNSIANNGVLLETFEARIKNRETATMVYAFSDKTHMVVCYMNFKYYVFMLNENGEITQEGDYKHYSLWENDYLYFYNEKIKETVDSFYMDEANLTLKVVK